MNKLFDLSGKKVVITGAAGLLGRQHAFAVADANASLILIDMNLVGLEDLKKALSSHTQVNLYQVDIRDEAQIRACVADIVLSLSSEDELVLINNAAIDAKVSGSSNENFSRLENFQLPQWELELMVGLTAAMLWCKHLGPVMASRGKGCIINIASDLGVIAPNQNLYRKDGISEELQNVKPVTYSVIKHGLIGLTKYLSTYWPQQGVRCNALAPGGVQVDQPQEFIQKVEKLIPMGRMAKANEYQGAIVFLASDASNYMNGQVLVMDGGRSVW